MHDAVADGSVSAGHADALAGVVKDLDERGRHDLKELASTLVDSAKTSTVDQFSRELRKLGQILSRSRRRPPPRTPPPATLCATLVDRFTGMCHTDLVLDPLTDAAVAAALGAAVSRRTSHGADDRTLDQVKADILAG